MSDNQPLTNAQIDHIFDTIREVSIQYVAESPDNFVGMPEADIVLLEQTYAVTFPEAYRKFLQRFPGAHLKIFDKQAYGKYGIASAHEVAEALLEQDNFTLPEGAFPFSQWQGYQFYYFVNTGDANPEVFLYIEAGFGEPPENYSTGCLTDWLLELAMSNIALYGRLEGHDTEAGIEQLRKLVINQ